MAEDLTEKYPHIAFRKQWELSSEGYCLLGQCEAYVQAISNIPLLPEVQRKLMEVSLIKGAQATAAIEGNTLTEEEIAAIWAEGKHLSPSKSYLEQEVRNVLEAMNAVAQDVAERQAAALLTEDLICTFHRSIGKDLGKYFDAAPGRYREDSRAVGPYRCPDYQDIQALMASYCRWMREEFHFERGQSFTDTVLQAIIAHIYLEFIHPFGDGNGRTGRLIEFYILLRGGLPTIASHILSNHYNQTRSAYYHHFKQAKDARSLTSFIQYALVGFRDGLKETLESVQQQQWLITWQHYIYQQFDDAHTQVLKRRRNLILALAPSDNGYTLEEVRRVNVDIAVEYANLGDRTLYRDVQDLVQRQLLRREGKMYWPNLEILRHFVPHKRTV